MPTSIPRGFFESPKDMDGDALVVQ